ncbi:O-antigen ligase family protein [Vibrio furnissii]|uniref:O-antigen ligase family protein n=1 Tax=Vibrio furnissii TaxID=29494 RepID=UPI001EECD0F5|nr:O-antigen ligase family protein [Vibrio furnissii]MCG6212892.1 O-antigen ligase family protein [Vibrio furnissii]
MVFYSRFIGLLVGLCLIVILLTYRSFETKFVFYLSWLSGLFIVVLFASTTIIKVKLDRVTALILSIIVPWVVIGLLFSPFAFDKAEHFKVFIITTFYMITSVFLADFIIKSKINIRQLTFIMLNAWSVVNLLLLVLFFLGVYVPEKHEFSGVFHDRNVFSITTLLVIGFAVSHLDVNCNRISKFAVYFSVSACFLMIIISKSITGNLGLLVLMFLYSQRFSLIMRVITFGFLISVLVLVVITDNPLSARISRFVIGIMGDTDSLNTNESAYLRIYLIKSGFELIMQYPWFGVGLNNAKEFVVWPDREYGSFLHNTYLDIFTSGGIPLFVVYYSPIFYSFFSLLKCRIKVRANLADRYYSLWKLAFVTLSLKLICDLSWTTYFEYFMVFTVIFSIYITFYLKRLLRQRSLNLKSPLQ